MRIDAAFRGLKIVLMALALCWAQAGWAGTAADIDAKVDAALSRIMRESTTAQALAKKAVAVLVFPNIVKAGFGFGGQYGEGALRRNGATTVGYFNIVAASFGFQIGAQSFSEVIFFMTPEALSYLERSGGFEVGADANVAVIDKGLAADITTSTVQDPIVAMVFGQQGVMAGATIQGSKITRINPR